MSISNHHTCLLCSSSNPLLLSYIVEHRVLDIVIIIPVISSNFKKDDFSRAEPILLLHTVLKFNFSSNQRFSRFFRVLNFRTFFSSNQTCKVPQHFHEFFRVLNFRIFSRQIKLVKHHFHEFSNFSLWRNYNRNFSRKYKFATVCNKYYHSIIPEIEILCVSHLRKKMTHSAN